MEPQISLPCSQGPAIGQISRPCVAFRKKLFFFLLWGVVSPPPNPQAENCPLFVVRDCLPNTFAFPYECENVEWVPFQNRFDA
jgi:hypothetical protein